MNDRLVRAHARHRARARLRRGGLSATFLTGRTEMAFNNGKRRAFSRRRFIQGAAAAAAPRGRLLAGASRAAREHDPREHHSRGHDSECEGSRDLTLVNGRFLTLDAHNSVVSAIGIRDGRIVEVGRGGALGPCGRTINLKGATVIPGLIDSHVHFVRCGQNPGHEVRIIETAASVGELQQMIGARIRELDVPAGEFITCVGGWNINGLAEKRLPTLAELDAAAPNHAVYLSATGAGGAVTNSVGPSFFASRGVTVTINAGAAATTCSAAMASASGSTAAPPIRATSTSSSSPRPRAGWSPSIP